MAAGPDFDLPEPVLAVLPSDPFEQLDVARKITSIALATRVSKLESESSRLRQKIAEKEDLIAELQAQIHALDASLADASDKLSRAEEEKENLLNENSSLSGTVKKLTRDVSKLEVFRKTLMQSLQEDDENSHAGGTHAVAKQRTASFPSGSALREEDATPPPLNLSSAQTQFSETGSYSEDSGSVEMDNMQIPSSRHGTSHGFVLASQTSTPRLTPPDSPTRLSASASPTRWHSMSFSSSRSMFDDRSSIFSSVPSSHHSSMSGSLDAASQTARGRIDGKEFFRQVRSRLSYEQFGAFLANVKELNSHKQSREETLRKADEIFGPDNKDLYAIFEGLITRNVH
ncbi:uncharacterized protein At4g15545 [Magnolia sinica]|uniref:uncharacterized protein At4g15545 n=1 Tax=Magnolia sinica TaxID=86752 RepID=UPI00265B141F|nr:uncharacterized protein At4g15545 [Magnolia sinica]